MNPSFISNFKNLLKIQTHWNSNFILQKIELLKLLKQNDLPNTKLLIKYNDLLLFLHTHPANEELLRLTNSELERIAKFLKRLPQADKIHFENSGLPYTNLYSRLSCDLISWLIEQQIEINCDLISPEGTELVELLKLTLPDIEKEFTAICDTNESLLEVLKIRNKNLLPFILNQCNQFNSSPLVKDFHFDKLQLIINVQTKANKYLSKTYNRLAVREIFYQPEICKKWNYNEILNKPLPKVHIPDSEWNSKIVSVSKIKLLLLQRETEPVSYMDAGSIRYYELERGISIAVFTMVPERQLPLESYVGYTLFKNGYPAAYGGAWILGNRALFGINIFDWFRGGESGFIMAQLLRTYRQLFSVDYFEIEPYQYGLNNPEGIESGAFWFYYRFGFKPLDPELSRLAKQEVDKMQKNKLYRSSKNTLLRFTESNLALNLAKYTPIAMWQIRNRITNMLHTNYKDDRQWAKADCIKKFQTITGDTKTVSEYSDNAFIDFAFICAAYKLTDQNAYRLAAKLSELKAQDVYKYQDSLRIFLEFLRK